MSTRYNYRNVNGQNEYCNSWDNDGYRHAKGIDERWGKGTAEKLHKLSQKTKKWEIWEIETLLAAANRGLAFYMVEYDAIKI